MNNLNTSPGPYEATVLADSVCDDIRLTTMVVCMPRIVLAEFNTHRVFSRNSASSRAIPVEKRITALRSGPYAPEVFKSNKKGMQAGKDLDWVEATKAQQIWDQACNAAIGLAERLAEVGVHKQWANRLLEPFSWQTIIVTATEWDNFFALRVNPDAQDEIRKAAANMQLAMRESEPLELREGEWHLPLVTVEERMMHTMLECANLSVARCARVSYLTHDGEYSIEADLKLCERLRKSGHMSPFEHAAYVGNTIDGTLPILWRQHGENLTPEFVGNFHWPWVQYRKTLEGEDVFMR